MRIRQNRLQMALHRINESIMLLEASPVKQLQELIKNGSKKVTRDYDKERFSLAVKQYASLTDKAAFDPFVQKNGFKSNGVVDVEKWTNSVLAHVHADLVKRNANKSEKQRAAKLLADTTEVVKETEEYIMYAVASPAAARYLTHSNATISLAADFREVSSGGTQSIGTGESSDSSFDEALEQMTDSDFVMVPSWCVAGSSNGSKFWEHYDLSYAEFPQCYIIQSKKHVNWRFMITLDEGGALGEVRDPWQIGGSEKITTGLELMEETIGITESILFSILNDYLWYEGKALIDQITESEQEVLNLYKEIEKYTSQEHCNIEQIKQRFFNNKSEFYIADINMSFGDIMYQNSPTHLKDVEELREIPIKPQHNNGFRFVLDTPFLMFVFARFMPTDKTQDARYTQLLHLLLQHGGDISANLHDPEGEELDFNVVDALSLMEETSLANLFGKYDKRDKQEIVMNRFKALMGEHIRHSGEVYKHSGFDWKMSAILYKEDTAASIGKFLLEHNPSEMEDFKPCAKLLYDVMIRNNREVTYGLLFKKYTELTKAICLYFDIFSKYDMLSPDIVETKIIHIFQSITDEGESVLDSEGRDIEKPCSEVYKAKVAFDIFNYAKNKYGMNDFEICSNDVKNSLYQMIRNIFSDGVQYGDDMETINKMIRVDGWFSLARVFGILPMVENEYEKQFGTPWQV